jgi:hypothetical protein
MNFTGRGGRFLSPARDGQFNKEETPHAALTESGKRGPRRPPEDTFSTSPGLMSLPLSGGKPAVVCEYTTHKMHAQPDHVERYCQKAELRPPTSTQRFRGWTQKKRRTRSWFSLPRPPVHPNLQCIAQKRERRTEKTPSTIEMKRIRVDAWTWSPQTAGRSAVKVRPPKKSEGGRAGRVSGDLT